MTDDYSDYERERWLDELYEEHKPQAIEDFTTDRLRSYYIANPDLARPSFDALLEARGLLATAPRSALVLASAAAEVGIKAAILRPVVVGLVHTEAIAGHIADLVIKQTGLDRFQELLFALLNHLASFDLTTYARQGARVTLWQEIQINISLRNRVLHRCAAVTLEEATLAAAVAGEVLEVLFLRTVEGLGCHLHEGYHICTEFHLPTSLKAFLRDA